MREQGSQGPLGFLGQLLSFIALRAGNTELAEHILDECCRYLQAQGEHGNFSTSAARRAVLLAELGRLDEAATWAAKAADVGAPDDITTHLVAHRALAKVAARRGEPDAAEAHAREATRLAVTTDFLEEQADAYVDLAEILELAGRHTEAAGTLKTAIATYRAKGDLTGEAQAQSRLDGGRM